MRIAVSSRSICSSASAAARAVSTPALPAAILHQQQQQQQQQQRRPIHFAKHGALLILSRTNTFRTLIAETFIRSAIERRRNEQQKKQQENDRDLSEFDPTTSSVSSNSLLARAPASLLTVTTAGQEHLPLSLNQACQQQQQHQQQLHPLAKDILLNHYQHKVDADVMNSLWSKCISVLQGQHGRFDVVVTLLTPPTVTSTSSRALDGTADNFSLLEQEEEDDNDSFSSSAREIEDDAVDPASLLPPGVPSSLPSHWTPHADAACFKMEKRMFSPRNPEVLKRDSIKKYQDDYAGEPLFSRPKRIQFPAGAKRLRWYVPDVSERRPMESERDHHLRAMEAVSQIDRLCDALLTRAVEFEERYK